MITLNNNFHLLPESYLFSIVRQRLDAYRQNHPEDEIIRMDIGDVTRPIAPAAVAAMHAAVDELARTESFHGYGPEQGYLFLREAIADYDYRRLGIAITPDEIFISDGAKSDLGNLGELFSHRARVAVPDPGYPVYADDNIIDGRNRTDAPIIHLPLTPENHFVPPTPDRTPDLIYLCYPNNPTGASISRHDLSRWVDYARRVGAVIIYDPAYEAYIRDASLPHSIYEIEGAEEVAIEVRSFSKTGGFTGIRCGYTVVPHALKGCYADGTVAELHRLWMRRQSTKFNGASYISQRGAAALYTPEGRRQVEESIDYYMENARLLREGMAAAGYEAFGGENAPYVWVRTPDGMTSWEFFDHLLERYQLSSTPGAGFGTNGEGFVRLTAFNTRSNTLAALRRLRD